MAERGRRNKPAAANAPDKIEKKEKMKKEERSSDIRKLDKKVKLPKIGSRKIPKKAVLAIVLTAIIGIGAYSGYDRIKDQSTMGCRILVDNVDVSWMSVEDAADKILEEFQSATVVFEEEGKEIYETSLLDAGYSLDRDKLVSELTRIKEEREPCHLLFEKKKSLHADYQVVWDDTKMREAFSGDKLDNGSERTASEDAYIQYNEDTHYFEIVPSVLGNEIDNAKLLNQVQQVLNETFSENLINHSIEVSITSDLYKRPKVAEDQEELNRQLTEKNQKIDSYASVQITYTFGDVTDTIPRETIESWIQISKDEITLDEASMRNYVDDLSTRYNTQYVPRYFSTSYGSTVVIENNEYGYWIDKEGEYEQLISDLESGQDISREPVYTTVGWKRNGNDDLVGGYAEVSIAEQHVWLYYNGELIIDADCITGQPEKLNTKTGEMEDLSTYLGSYKIAYTESPATLESDIYGYEVDVQYWMPFVYGQGFHDASWQPAFGGSIYLTNGSHGCINLSEEVAAVFYQYLDEGFPVIIY